MNDMSRLDEPASYEDTAFGFDGSWREFAPIAFTNLLLTIVTLGIYRFWGIARERRYLWARTRFVDEKLEWTGTGKELFVGALLVMLLFGIPFFLITNVGNALMLRGETAAAIALIGAAFVTIFYLTGLARYRALRYRLSRTRWRGIRGGSDDPGFGYGVSHMAKTAIGYLPLGLAVPWSMTSLWNERWGKMSFGPHAFQANADPGLVFGRYLLFYLSPLVLFVGGALSVVLGGGAGGLLGGEDGIAAGAILGTVGALLFFYFGLGLIAVAYYAKFARVAVGSLSWGDVTFRFTASTWQWIKLFLGDLTLVVFTLGIGWIFLGYRHWKFFVTHLEASGDILVDELSQSTTATARHGEGLLDALDVGAF